MLGRVENQNWPSLEAWFSRFDYQLQKSLIVFFQSRRLDPSDAEDLTQQVFLRVLEFLDRGGEVSDLRGYAFGVAHNVFREELKRRARVATFSDLSPQDMGRAAKDKDEKLNPAPGLEEEETRRIKTSSLQDALQELSPANRKLLLDYYPDVADRGQLRKEREKLAARLGISESNLRVRLSRIRGRLEESVREKIYRRCGRRWL
ncbi:MAG TPA: sigma-70 family RNA polymerase sigma factor [Pyrinomonadaceae bacterium]